MSDDEATVSCDPIYLDPIPKVARVKRYYSGLISYKLWVIIGKNGKKNFYKLTLPHKKPGLYEEEKADFI